MRVGSPGALVGQAWLNIEQMKGTPEDDPGTGKPGGKGTERGRFGLAVADVGKGGRARRSGVRPGMRRATTLRTDRGFWKTEQRQQFRRNFLPGTDLNPNPATWRGISGQMQHKVPNVLCKNLHISVEQIQKTTYTDSNRIPSLQNLPLHVHELRWVSLRAIRHLIIPNDSLIRA